MEENNKHYPCKEVQSNEVHKAICDVFNQGKCVMEEDGCCNALNRFRTIAQNVMKMKKEEKESKNKDNS